jgi:cysteine desulfurase
MSPRPIYLDFNATTPVDPRALAAMRPFLEAEFGNPSSAHTYGKAAAEAVARARAQVASLLDAAPEEVVFTSCASESVNLAIKGVAFARRARGRHLVTSAVEHPAVAEACRYLQREHGFEVTRVPVGGDGRVSADAVRAALRDETVLISLIHAQNETGVLQPVAEVGALARRRGIAFHVDASQAVGKVEVSARALGCDLLTVAGHKLYAPKGVGALYVRAGTELHPLIHGAPYEGGRRAGTANVPYVVALGEACEVAGELLRRGEPDRQRGLCRRLWERLRAGARVQLNGHPEARLPNTLNVSFLGEVGNELLARVPEIAASTGSACHAGVSEPSEVLLAMGMPAEVALGAVRLSVGRTTTEDEVDLAAERLISACGKLPRT